MKANTPKDYEETIKLFLSTKEGRNKKFLQWIGKNFSQNHFHLNDTEVSDADHGSRRTVIYLDKKDSVPISYSLWLLKIIHGEFDPDKLVNEFYSMLPREDVLELYDCILRKPLKQRKMALCIFSLFKGIPKRDISTYLNIQMQTIYEYIRRYKIGGAKRLLNRKTTAKKKFEIPLYSEEIFSIIHSPPSSYGFNRTTWKLDDIKKVMAEKNLTISRGYISKIINNAGYKITKARKRLTSNDPEYREKLENIQNILSKLGSKEKFFSIDEFGPFGIKIYGGRSIDSSWGNENNTSVAKK